MKNIKEIYQGKKVLITGHTGFKGSWLSIWLAKLGAEVIGISDSVPTSPSNFIASNISDTVKDYRVNIMDLDSDKAYDNVEWVWGYRESDPLGGKDPYSASKGMAELAIKTYVNSFFTNPENGTRIGITRAGNVIGGGDWARNRIVPDCVDAWSNNKVVDIRRPDATRPWQHVLEPLSGYLSLGSELYDSPNMHGEAYNFGPPANQNYPVRDLINEMSLSWKNVRWNDKSDDSSNFHEAGLLKLNCDKALFDLEWLPTLEFPEAVKVTIDWYKTYYEKKKKSMWEFSSKQIDEFTNLAETKKRAWATY